MLHYLKGKEFIFFECLSGLNTLLRCLTYIRSFNLPSNVHVLYIPFHTLSCTLPRNNRAVMGHILKPQRGYLKHIVGK